MKFCLTGELRRCGELHVVAFEMPRLAPASAIVSAKPPWLANCPGLHSGKKSTVPPVRPKRASLTRRDVMVERSAVTNEKRFESWLPKFGKPGNAGSALFRKSTNERN